MTSTTKNNFQPTLEALETRDMMDAGLGHALPTFLLPTGGDFLQNSHMRLLASAHEVASSAAAALTDGLRANTAGTVGQQAAAVNQPIQSDQSGSRAFADAIAKIFSEKVVDNGFNRWFIWGSDLYSYQQDLHGRLTGVVIRVHGPFIESGTVTIEGQMRNHWSGDYFECNIVTARTDSGKQYVSLGYNLEDFVKPLLTKVYAPQGTATVNGSASADTATSETFDAWVSHANELLNSVNAARWAAVDAVMNAVHFGQHSHEL
ncbi:MAG: hypothetical protein ACYC3I_21485 [Gemmataceae bacterium]